MIRNTRSYRALAGTALAVGALLLSTPPASAFSYANGDLVTTFVKNGYELILNLGASPTNTAGKSIDVSTLTLPSQFSGSLSGATWTALSVRNPDAVFVGGPADGAGQANIILTTNNSPTSVSFFQIGDAQSQLRPPGSNTAWFGLLTSASLSVNGTDVLENTASRLVIAATNFASYSGNLGFGSNAVANTLPISTAGIVSGTVVGDALPLYELLQTLDDQLNFGTQISNLGTLNLVPEPGTALLLGAGLAGLVRFGRARNA
jgi:hypothetical protein